ncbi:MAG: accessory factor UbiK family protein [Rhodobacteraceae bacterium]|nr:MAG: accessory factor UbiK family protein [Paracoccaceae bacterium]
MQTRSRLFDDLSKLMTNAAGVAQGMREEAETLMRGRVERFLADSDLVTREEFEAVRDMAQKAREENESLKAELSAALERLAAMEKKRAPKAAG